MTVFSDPTQGGITFQDTRGVLECDVCNLPWCDHIREVLRTGLDTLGIWLKDGEGNDLDMRGLNIQVPLVPSLDVFSWVTIGELVGTVYKVYVHHGDIQDAFIGLIGHDEGRLTIRNMIVAWIFEVVDINVLPHCQARSHSPSKQNALHQNMRKPEGKVAEYYSWLYSKCCVECQYQITPVAADPANAPFDPDLIPT